MAREIKIVRGFDEAGRPVTKKMKRLRLRIWLHKSMTKGDLIEAAAIVMNWLELNALESGAKIDHGINITGFDGQSAELWEDRGSRTFCKMVLEAFAPAICGLVNWNAEDLAVQIRYSGMSLLGLCAVALGEELGHPPEIGHKRINFPILEIGQRLLDYVQKFSPAVNSRADQLASGSSPSPHPMFASFCEGIGERIVYLAPGMKRAVHRIYEAAINDLVESGQGGFFRAR